jgi:peroxiredoxin
VQPGEPAPDFKLPSVHQDVDVSLADYQGRSLFLAIFLGLWCPFCRRKIAQLGATREELGDRGIETLAVVGTELDNARLYFKYRPTRVPLVADPGLVTHRAYGLPQPKVDQSVMELLAATRINPTGELPAPVPATEIGAILDRADNYRRTEADTEELEIQWPMLRAQFLVDGDSIVRWANVECAKEGLAGFGKFPSTAEVLDAAQQLGLAAD